MLNILWKSLLKVSKLVPVITSIIAAIYSDSLSTIVKERNVHRVLCY